MLLAVDQDDGDSVAVLEAQLVVGVHVNDVGGEPVVGQDALQLTERHLAQVAPRAAHQRDLDLHAFTIRPTLGSDHYS